MKYKFIMLKERVSYLVSELKDKVVVEDYENDQFVTVEINIEYGTDLLSLFHAGVRMGMDIMYKVD